MAFWHRNNAGEFYQKRLSDERKLAEDRRNQAVQAGRASALKRKERHSTDVATELELNGNYPKPNPLNNNIIVQEGLKTPLKPHQNPSQTPNVNENEDENPLWFEGHVIRLNKKDYMAWQKMTGWGDDYFNKILSERDDWLNTEPAKQKNWFISTSKYLRGMQNKA